MKPNIVIGSQRRWQQSLTMVLGAMAIVLAIPVVYGLARNASFAVGTRAGDKLEKLEAEHDQLMRQLRDERLQGEQWRQEVADLKHGREIDRQAYVSVQKSVVEQQQEVTSLREQLAFYRGVVSPQALQSGLHVNELAISRGSLPGTYRYDLVLVQAARQKRRASGRVEIRFIGRDQTAQRSFALSDLVAEKAGPIAYSFRHFQEFGGNFQLPDGFRPMRVIVTLMPDSGQSPHVEEEFEWRKIQDAS
jgi:hypothetical protein